jgi:hypothetical protein
MQTQAQVTHEATPVACFSMAAAAQCPTLANFAMTWCSCWEFFAIPTSRRSYVSGICIEHGRIAVECLLFYSISFMMEEHSSPTQFGGVRTTGSRQLPFVMFGESSVQYGKPLFAFYGQSNKVAGHHAVLAPNAIVLPVLLLCSRATMNLHSHIEQQLHW